MHEETAIELMDQFADRTGVTSGAEPVRYLWTDAFAVCNDLGLARATGDDRFADRAVKLVRQVHETLGKHRSDDAREGWLSGLPDEEGRSHPTAGGLRIGKPLPERSAGERQDQQLEWERDGQYFHYLTRWMHALDLMTRTVGESRYNVWGREMAETAYDAFTYVSPLGGRRMYWKMSIDLSRPLVSSMGQHDPLDGWVTCRQLEATATKLPQKARKPQLGDVIARFREMVAERDWTTTDPLGLGGLLIDASRMGQLPSSESSRSVFEAVLSGAHRGLRQWARTDALARPARTRLAFRELGLAIGLWGIDRMLRDEALPPGTRERELLRAIGEFLVVRDRIVEFWLKPEHREVETWTEHQDINDVMLATALAPAGCLTLPALE